MRAVNGVSMFGAAIFIPVLVLGLLQIVGARGVAMPAIVHLVLTLVIVVAGVRFWRDAVHVFAVTGSIRTFVIAFGLLFGAVLMFGHALFSEWGILAGNADRAEWYARLGTFVVALALLVGVAVTERAVPLRERRPSAWTGGVIFLVLLGLAMALVEGARMVDVSVWAIQGRWTPLGRFLQITSIVALTVAAIRYLHGAFLIRSEVALAFATGTVLLTMAELTGALAVTPTDAPSLVAHLWTAMGYLAFVWGGFASRVGHHEGEVSADLGTVS